MQRSQQIWTGNPAVLITFAFVITNKHLTPSAYLSSITSWALRRLLFFRKKKDSRIWEWKEKAGAERETLKTKLKNRKTRPEIQILRFTAAEGDAVTGKINQFSLYSPRFSVRLCIQPPIQDMMYDMTLNIKYWGSRRATVKYRMWHTTLSQRVTVRTVLPKTNEVKQNLFSPSLVIFIDTACIRQLLCKILLTKGKRKERMVI